VDKVIFVLTEFVKNKKPEYEKENALLLFGLPFYNRCHFLQEEQQPFFQFLVAYRRVLDL
jgi:hypothetical protein